MVDGGDGAVKRLGYKGLEESGRHGTFFFTGPRTPGNIGSKASNQRAANTGWMRREKA